MKNSTFTLIELLVTMATLLVLASLLQPSLMKVISHAVELESSQDLRVLHQGTMFYSDDRDNYLPMKYMRTDRGWTSLWMTSVGEYLENGTKNPAFQNSKVQKNRFADYAPNDFIIQSDFNSKLHDLEEPDQKFLFFEGAPRSNLNGAGAWTVWGQKIVKKVIYNTTIAQRHGPLDDPIFYSVFVDGHTERIQYIEFWEDDKARRGMTSPH